MECGDGKVVTRHVVDTEFTADSAEWCPLDENADLLLCGMYQLTDPDSSTTPSTENVPTDVPKKRIGRIYLFRVLDDNNGQFSCEEMERLETAGVLDIKWNSLRLNQCPAFVVADSDGNVNLYSVSVDRSGLEKCVSQLSSACVCVEGKKALVLSLDWSTAVNKSSPAQIISSDSEGRLNLLDCNVDGLTLVSQWKAHDFEGWIAAFNAWDTNIVYSGGDDCKLKGWDVRCKDKPIFVSNRHMMGVVSIQSNPVKEFILATGSYDEHVLLWDTRQMKSPLSNTALGGGVFRIKWHPRHGQKVLTATMHNGFHVLDAREIPSGASSLPLMAHYCQEEHGSLAYGADWSRSISMDSAYDRIATCSFYDHSLHIWDIHP
ncbi:diphthine methyltransferase-like [Liolophura sinensis]|uniref:diphthine methyltransferase-like n=1 Tax=Liolophura sinensis TaxID=3198878 RepID=UPI0031585270